MICVKISYFNSDGKEVFANLPAKLENCSVCFGNEMNNHFHSFLMKGSQTCTKCNGSGTQKVIDETSFSLTDHTHYQNYINEIDSNHFNDLEWAKEFKHESMMGRWQT